MPVRKPLRMRAACGHCHGAKVKCSGEKTGCRRCAKLGLRCEYGVSMVGRASKKRTVDGGGGDVPMADGDDHPPISASAGLPIVDPSPADAFTLPLGELGEQMDFGLAPQDLLSITGLDDFAFYAFPQNHQDDGADLDIVSATAPVPDITLSAPGLSVADSMSRDGMSPPTPSPPLAPPAAATTNNNNYNNNNNLAGPCTATNSRNSARRQKRNNSPPPPLPPQFQATRDGSNGQENSGTVPAEPASLSWDEATRTSATESMEPIFCFTRLTYYLERNLAAAGSQPLDRTLTVIRGALHELMELVRWEESKTSYGCRALIFACLTLIVRMYSQAYARHRTRRERQRRQEEEERGQGEKEQDGARTQREGQRRQRRRRRQGQRETDGGDKEERPEGHVLRSEQEEEGEGEKEQRQQQDAALRLGSFEIDPEDQLKLQNQMIAAELGRAVHVIKTMAQEQAKLCQMGGKCGNVRNFNYLVESATELKTTMERESVHDKRMVHPLI